MMSSGTILRTRPVVPGPAAEVVVERLELEPIVGRVADEAVRPGADRMLVKVRGRAVGHDRDHQVDRKRPERLLQREHDGVAIARVDRLDHAIGALARRQERGIEQAPEREDDVGRSQLVAVVKPDAAAQGRRRRYGRIRVSSRSATSGTTRRRSSSVIRLLKMS